MKHKLSVLNDIHLLPQAQNKITELFAEPIEFPTDETQPSFKQLVARTADADMVLVSPGAKLTEEYFTTCPSVRYIGVCGTSTVNVASQPITTKQIKLTNIIDYGDEPTAEFIFMQLATLARGMGRYQWKPYPTELMNKSVGIIGLGALGQAVAHLALAYKMKVGYYSPHRKAEWESKGLRYLPLRDLLKTSEVIILCGPTNLTLLGEKDFGLMQPNSILVQASSGNVFEKAAFLEWIREEHHYALFDYAAGEDNYQSYEGLPNVIFPKIVAGHTNETKERLGYKVVENLKEYLKTAR